MPQCYGCHAKRDARETHLDKLTLQETPGWWEEGRSYIRYERPMLGVWQDEVVIVTPGCPDVVTLIDEQGQISGGFQTVQHGGHSIPQTTKARGTASWPGNWSPVNSENLRNLAKGRFFRARDGALGFWPA